MSEVVVIVCTGRGSHARRVLDRVALAPSAISGAQLVTSVLTEGQLQHLDADETLRRLEIVTYQGKNGYGHRWRCPSCRRDIQRRDADLVEPLRLLMALGVEELDISATP